MDYSKACEILGLTTPKSPAKNAELAESMARGFTSKTPLKFKVAVKTVIGAAQ